MMQQSINYARAISQIPIPEEAVWEARDIFEKTPALLEALGSPVVDLKAKRRVIDRVFPKEMGPVLKVMCGHQAMGCVPELFEAYRAIISEEKGVLLARLTCHKAPSRPQIDGMEAFLRRRFGREAVELAVELDPGMLGGFILRAGDWEFDWSVRGRIRRMQTRLTGR